MKSDYHIASDIRKNNNTLMHHGIDGQKWGKRNGPPYPLSSDISTGKRLKRKIYNKEQRDRISKAQRVGAYAGGLPGAGIAAVATKHRINKEIKNDEKPKYTKLERKRLNDAQQVGAISGGPLGALIATMVTRKRIKAEKDPNYVPKFTRKERERILAAMKNAAIAGASTSLSVGVQVNGKSYGVGGDASLLSTLVANLETKRRIKNEKKVVGEDNVNDLYDEKDN